MKADSKYISRLNLATASFGLSSGLLEQVNNCIAVYPGTNFRTRGDGSPVLYTSTER